MRRDNAGIVRVPAVVVIPAKLDSATFVALCRGGARGPLGSSFLHKVARIRESAARLWRCLLMRSGSGEEEETL